MRFADTTTMKKNNKDNDRNASIRKKMMSIFKEHYEKCSMSKKELTDFDFWYLKYILTKKQNELNVILKNEHFYSKRTISSYKRMYESVKRLLDSLQLTYEDKFDEQEIPTSW